MTQYKVYYNNGMESVFTNEIAAQRFIKLHKNEYNFTRFIKIEDLDFVQFLSN